MGVVELAETYRLATNTTERRPNKDKYAQFFTPSSIAEFMASLFRDMSRYVRLLDPGCGVGSLFSAFVNECAIRESVKSLGITAIDIDPKLKSLAEDSLESCQSYLRQQGVHTNGVVEILDFVSSYSSRISDTLFSESTPKFTHAIINPPYGKIRADSTIRHSVEQLGASVPNLYAAFVVVAVELLEEGGELVVILPRSFCNGTYYEDFRSYLSRKASIEHIHVFGSRVAAFKDDEVLQENVIVRLAKRSQSAKIRLTSSSNADFRRDPSSSSVVTADFTQRDVAVTDVMNGPDRKRTFNLPLTTWDSETVEFLNSLGNTIFDLGVEISTGPVVDFRLRDFLQYELTEDAAPLLYPIHCRNGVRWPTNSKKPNAIHINKRTKPFLWENAGFYVLIRRFSSKEEAYRVRATFYDSRDLAADLIGFDNKLNVLHSRKHGLSEDMALGLYVYLNSTIVDEYYRQLGGHTQVNAGDIRLLPFPSETTVRALGKEANENCLSQERIDEIMAKVLTGMNSKKPPRSEIDRKIEEALEILTLLGLPRAQRNERSALTMLALANLAPSSDWQDAEARTLGVTPIMDWVRENYGKEYAPNTRETFRRQTLHQFVQAGIALYNPDDPERPVNSPRACYQIATDVLELVRVFNSEHWDRKLTEYRVNHSTLAEQYAREREMNLIPLRVSRDETIGLTPGEHSTLIKAIIEEFGPRFLPGAEVLYVGDTGDKVGYFDQDAFSAVIGVDLDLHGKIPDVILYDQERNWLSLIESVTSHGPVDPKRYEELRALFSQSAAELVYVTAFPNKQTMARFVTQISWETEVWVADNPSHLIHFDGKRFLGPY